MALHCGVVDLPEALLLEKTDSPPPSTQQLPVTTARGWDRVPNSPLYPGI